MRSSKKHIITIEELLKSDNKAKLQDRYKKSISDAQGDKQLEADIESKKVKTGKFSLRTKILNSEWLGHRPASKAVSWLFKEVFKDAKTFKYNKRIMYGGGLFMFKYFNPKYKDTDILPFFDKFPLVISLGPRVTEEGIRNLGFNLHLLPPRIRIIVLCYIFEIYKNFYRFGYLMKKDIHPVNLDYKEILKVLEPYGVEFSIRMYIPQRQTEIVNFPLKYWHKAIFIPSRGYYDIRAKALIRLWKKWCREKHLSISDSINWKKVI